MKDTKIEWCDHTWNPWWGCQRVSPGCEHCYAETMAKRYGHQVWGPAKTTGRRAMSEDYWKQPAKWNKAAQEAGKPARVFCSSMADVFEANPALTEWKGRLFELIQETPWLTWLLLTKRPENIENMIPYRWVEERQNNVWFGFSAENQEYFEHRWQAAKYMARRGYIVFISCEPLLGPINLNPWQGADNYLGFRRGWVIAGGESGPGARPAQVEWFRNLRRQCESSNTPFFMKQMGAVWARDCSYASRSVAAWGDPKGHDMQYWPNDLRVREFPG